MYKIVNCNVLSLIEFNKVLKENTFGYWN
jgi:hypothetical protein